MRDTGRDEILMSPQVGHNKQLQPAITEVSRRARARGMCSGSAALVSLTWSS